MCEAEERNQRALHELRVMAGAWVLDLGKLQAILTGEGCNQQHGEKQ